MQKIKLPFTSSKAFGQASKSLMKHLFPSAQKSGAPPGTLVYTGKSTSETKIIFHQFDNKEYYTEEINQLGELPQKISARHTNWIDLTGFQNIELVKELGAQLNIDQLTLEDVLNISQLPKIEGHDDYLYITLKLVEQVEAENTFEFIHYSLIVKENVLITFSDNPNQILDSIDDRLKIKLSKIRSSSISYLTYRIIDTIVDHYYNTLEWFSNELANLEFELVEHPSKKHINTILTYKKRWMVLRKAIYPFKEAMRRLVNQEPVFIKSTGKIFISDLIDHLQSIGESMEIMRESLNDLMDLYNSTVSNKMNEVMKVLTIVSTIFIPMTFIAGIYGMNFQHMPELAWKNGYFYSLGFMLCIGTAMLLFMKSRRWL